MTLVERVKGWFKRPAAPIPVLDLTPEPEETVAQVVAVAETVPGPVAGFWAIRRREVPGRRTSVYLYADFAGHRSVVRMDRALVETAPEAAVTGFVAAIAEKYRSVVGAAPPEVLLAELRAAVAEALGA